MPFIKPEDHILVRSGVLKPLPAPGIMDTTYGQLWPYTPLPEALPPGPLPKSVFRERPRCHACGAKKPRPPQNFTIVQKPLELSVPSLRRE